MSLWTLVFCAALAGTGGLLAYGIVSADLLEQEIWWSDGLRKLVWFVCSYASAAAILIVWRPRWFRPTVLAISLVYTLVVAGVAAVAAVALCLAAAYVVGKTILRRGEDALDELLALLLGLSLIATAIGFTAHLPVNYWWLYATVFLLILVLRPKLAVECSTRTLGLLRPVRYARRWETAAQAVLAFVLAAHWLVSLKPEAGADGLAMHLAIPAWVAQHHFWSFDFQHFVWAVMPMAGDWIYTAAFLPGGEAAARLLNFAMLCTLGALVFAAIRRWAMPPAAFLSTALFCSSPIVQLVTGTLFVENFWAALLAGSLAAVWRFRETRARRYLIAAGVLLGTAMQTKIGSLAFFIPVAILAGRELARSGVPRRWAPAAAALGAFLLFAAPPYVNAYVKTGNPVFPFANATFRSPYFESDSSFVDLRFKTPLNWNTLYAMTIHTDRFLEGQKGALGFQYLLLLPLLPLAFRRKWPFEVWTAAGVSLLFFLLTFASHPNARYIYPALGLSTISIGWLFAACRQRSVAAYTALSAAAVLAVAGNVYFLPASGWYHKDFFLNPFDPDAARDYLARTAPAREFIDYMNSTHPGVPVMLIASTDIAGASGPAYSNLWHTHTFRRELLKANDAMAVLQLMNRYGIRHFIAPTETSGIIVAEPALQSFLTEFTSAEQEGAKYYLARLGREYENPRVHRQLPPVAAGRYDDSGARISFAGRWYRDQQFADAYNRTLTYSDAAGDHFRLRFTGTEVRYLYTRAANRGIAEVFLNGRRRLVLDMYSADTEWQASTVIGDLTAGEHELEVRITGEKNAQSSGTFVDVDALIVQ